MQAYQKDIDIICKELLTNTKKGLDEKAVYERLKKYGHNIIKEEKKVSPLTILLQQFLSPLMNTLVIATIASFIIGNIKDAVVISITIVTNVILGFFQEWKALKSSESLKSYDIPYCTVIRDGKNTLIEARTLVPGDIVMLSAGSRIPADIRLFYTANFTVEEAILTGESRAINKIAKLLTDDLALSDRINMAYSGTYAISGKAQGIVVATGSKTEFGKIAELVRKTKQDATPLQKQIQKFNWFIGSIILAIVSIVFALGLIKHLPFTEIFIISIALAVSAVPEGLLISVTVVLATGMQRMLKRKALVRHLIAAETLGSISVICTDKTGTLTKGQMSIQRIVTKNHDLVPSQELPREVLELLEAGILNNDAEAEQRIGSPTEIALLEAALQAGVDAEQIRHDHPRLEEIPFSSNTKYMVTINAIDKTKRLIAKGAPTAIYNMCSMSQGEKNYFAAKEQEMAQNGMRVLAIAYKDKETISLKEDLCNLSLLGIVGLEDPLRSSAAKTISRLTSAGVRTIVITGDHQETALMTARQAGIIIDAETCLTGAELDKMSDQELSKHIKSVSLFARVDPAHKIRIVNALQKSGESVAMIGDGVNDAPALKSATIGVSLGSGSDVTKEVADMILLDNNLSTISAAVIQGRIIFDNIRKIIVFLTAKGFSEITLILGALLFNLPLPILAAQIFWINLITHGFVSIAFAMEPGEPQIITERPRAKNEPIVNTEMKIIIFLIGIITDIVLFGLYLVLLKKGFAISHIRTMIFTAISIGSLFYVFSVRSMRSSLFRVNPFQNTWLNIAVVGGLLMQLSVVYIPILQRLFATRPLALYEWGIIFGLSVIKITGIEITKECFLRHKNG